MICVVCQKPDATPERGLVCERCRLPLPGLLDDIAQLYGDLDLTPATSAGQRVTGSREAPLPLAVDPLDLSMPARHARVSEAGQLVPATVAVPVVGERRYVRIGTDGEPEYVAEEVRTQVRVRLHGADGQPLYTVAHDQVGHLAAATVLDSWVRDWRETRARGERLPLPTVPVLARWLRVRIDWVCDEHPAVDEFVAEMRALRQALRAATGDLPVKPERLWVPCKCDAMGLARHPGDDYPVRCAMCGRAMTEDDYAAWSRLVAAAVERSAA